MQSQNAMEDASSAAVQPEVTASAKRIEGRQVGEVIPPPEGQLPSFPGENGNPVK